MKKKLKLIILILGMLTIIVSLNNSTYGMGGAGTWNQSEVNEMIQEYNEKEKSQDEDLIYTDGNDSYNKADPEGEGDRKIVKTDKDGNETQYIYDEGENKVTIIDSEGNSCTYVVDPDNPNRYIPEDPNDAVEGMPSQITNGDLIWDLVVEGHEYTPGEGRNVDPLGDVVDGIVGILLLPAKYMLLVLGGIIALILGFFANGSISTLSIKNILFNEVSITDIDFFNFNVTDSTTLALRENVAIWYTSIRNLAAVILILISIYVGIRMAMSTIAEDKAKYKSMLQDWITSIAILFVLHYIMIFAIEINNALVNILKVTALDAGNPAEMFFRKALNPLTLTFTEGFGSALAYVLIEGVTLIFLLAYIKRMITLAFLIIIAPLVTVTYSIDKMGDGKSQAFNLWLKEFVYNILIQPFHCVAYLALGTTAFKLMDAGELPATFLGIIMIVFIYQSEDIIKHIFHFEGKSMARTVGEAAFIATAIGGIGKFTKSVGEFKESFKTANPKPRTANNNGGGPDSGEGGTGGGTPPTPPPPPAPPGGGSEGEGGGTPPTPPPPAPPGGGNPPEGEGGGQAGGNAGNSKQPRGKRILSGYIQVNRLVGTAAAGLALGASTGDLKNTLNFTALGLETGVEGNKKADTKKKRNSLIRAYNNYMQGQDAETVNRKAQAFLNGSEEPDPNDAREVAFRNALIDMNNRYKANGMTDDDKRAEAMTSLLTRIGNGEIGETFGSRIIHDPKGEINLVIDKINRVRERFQGNGGENPDQPEETPPTPPTPTDPPTDPPEEDNE